MALLNQSFQPYFNAQRRHALRMVKLVCSDFCFIMWCAIEDRVWYLIICQMCNLLLNIDCHSDIHTISENWRVWIDFKRVCDKMHLSVALLLEFEVHEGVISLGIVILCSFIEFYLIVHPRWFFHYGFQNYTTCNLWAMSLWLWKNLYERVIIYWFVSLFSLIQYCAKGGIIIVIIWWFR